MSERSVPEEVEVTVPLPLLSAVLDAASVYEAWRLIGPLLSAAFEPWREAVWAPVVADRADLARVAVYPVADGWWETDAPCAPPADTWLWQSSGRWVATRGEDVDEWYGDDGGPWPRTRSYPIGIIPPSGPLVFCNADHEVVTVPEDDRPPRGRWRELAEPDPSVGVGCVLCGDPLEVGQRPSLVTDAPADDDEAAKKAAGLAYTATARLAHEDCVWGATPSARPHSNTLTTKETQT